MRVLSRDMRAHAVCSKYLCYGGYTGWVVLDMQSLALDVFPALSPRFICNGMAADSSTRSVICTSLGQSSSWRAPTAPAATLAPLMFARRFQLVSLPVSQLGNSSADPSVVVDDLSRACGFGANEQARNLEYDSASSMVYISTQQ